METTGDKAKKLMRENIKEKQISEENKKPRMKPAVEEFFTVVIMIPFK